MFRTYTSLDGGLLVRHGKTCTKYTAAKARIGRMAGFQQLDDGEVRRVLPNGAERLVAVFHDGRWLEADVATTSVIN